MRVCLGFSSFCNSETALHQQAAEQRSDWPLILKTGSPAGQEPQFTNNQVLLRQMVPLARSPASSAETPQAGLYLPIHGESTGDILITDFLPLDCWSVGCTALILQSLFYTLPSSSKAPPFLFFLAHLPLNPTACKSGSNTTFQYSCHLKKCSHTSEFFMCALTLIYWLSAFWERLASPLVAHCVLCCWKDSFSLVITGVHVWCFTSVPSLCLCQRSSVLWWIGADQPGFQSKDWGLVHTYIRHLCFKMISGDIKRIQRQVVAI